MKETGEERWNRQARRPVRPYGWPERLMDKAGRLVAALRVLGGALMFLVGFWIFLYGALHLFMWVMRLLGWVDL